MEIFDIDGIKSNLRSEKPAFRKQGRSMFDSMISQLGSRPINSSDALGLIQAVMEYEGKEKQAALSKGKALGNDVAEFFRRVARFAMRSGHLLSKHIGPFLNHILSILSDSSLSDSYKSFHKSLLLDILVPRLTFSMEAPDALDIIDTTGLKGLLLVLEKAFKDAKTRKDSSMLKVLRATCSCLYMDVDVSILVNVVQWIYQLAHDENESDYRDYVLLMYASECLTSLLQYHALSLLPSVLDQFKGISQLLQKSYALCQFKDPQIEIIVSFISSVLNLSKNLDNVFQSSVVCMQKEILQGWSGIFLSDYSLQILCTSIQKRINKELRPSVIVSLYKHDTHETLKNVDSKVLMLIRTVAGVLGLYSGNIPVSSQGEESTHFSQSTSNQSQLEDRPLKRARMDLHSHDAWGTLTLLFDNLLAEFRLATGETKKKSLLLTHFCFVSSLLSETISFASGDIVWYHKLVLILSKMIRSSSTVTGDLDVVIQDWLCYMTLSLLENLQRRNFIWSHDTFSAAFEKDLVSLYFSLCRILETHALRVNVESGVSDCCKSVLKTALQLLISCGMARNTAVNLFAHFQKNAKTLGKHITVFDRLIILSSADHLGVTLDIFTIADILQLDIALLTTQLSHSLTKVTIENGSAFVGEALIVLQCCFTRVDIVPGRQLLYITSLRNAATEERFTVFDDVLNSLLGYYVQPGKINELRHAPNLQLSDFVVGILVDFWIKAARSLLEAQEGCSQLYLPLLNVLALLLSCPSYTNVLQAGLIAPLQERLCVAILEGALKTEKQDDSNSDLSADYISICNTVSLLSHGTRFKALIQPKLEKMAEQLWHKILNPVSATSHDTLPTIDIDITFSESSSADPFNLAESTLPARSISRGSLGQGSFKSGGSSVDTCTLIVRLMCAVRSSFRLLTDDFQACCSFLDRCLPLNTSPRMSTEAALALAEALALDGNFLLFQYVIEGCSTWRKEWGPIGYGRILRCFAHIIKDIKDFQTFDGQFNFFEYTISFAIPEDAELNKFTARYWFVRAYQVEIMAEMMKAKEDMSEIKTYIAELFSKYISDSDVRVQYVTACHCSLLTMHFKNKHKVYESLYQSSSNLWIDLLSQGSGRAAVLCLAVQLMVCCSFGKSADSNGSVRFRSLLDTMTSCATMHSYLADGPQSGQLQVLQSAAIETISSNPAIADASCLSVECLIQSWLGSKHCCSPLLSIEHELQEHLTLDTFPFACLFASSKTSLSISETLTLRLDWVLPAICGAEPTKLRWKALCNLCAHMGITASDANIASLLKDNVIPIKVAENFAALLSHVHEETSICDFYRSQAQYMAEFMEGTIRAAEIVSVMKMDTTSLLCGLLRRMMVYDESIDALTPDRPNFKVDWLNTDRIIAQMSKFLESLAKVVGSKDIPSFFGRLNVHFVLSYAAKHFKATQSISAVVLLVSFIRITMQCDTIFSSQRLTFVLLELLDSCMRYISTLATNDSLEDISKLLFQLAFDLLGFVKTPNSSLCVLGFIHRAFARTCLSSLSSNFIVFLQGYYQSRQIMPLAINGVYVKDIQRQLRALHTHDSSEVWLALLEYCCDPTLESEQSTVTCSCRSLINCIQDLAGHCFEGHPVCCGALWLLVKFSRVLLGGASAKAEHEALMNSSMDYRYAVGKALIALFSCISNISPILPQKPLYLPALTDQIIQLVHMFDSEFSWLESGGYNDLLPFSRYCSHQKFMKDCYKRCVDIAEQGDLLQLHLVAKCLRDVGQSNFDLISAWIIDEGGKDVSVEQTILAYLKYPSRESQDRFFIQAFFDLFGEESQLHRFGTNTASKSMSVKVSAKSALINKLISFMAEHALDDDVWRSGDCFGATQFDVYEVFIRKLCTHILLRHQSRSLAMQPLKKDSTTVITEHFFACALPLCLADACIAEMVFCSCLCHMIPQTVDLGKSEILQHLYHLISNHLCKSLHLRARRLGCKAFVMLLQYLTDNCLAMLSSVSNGYGQGTCLPSLICVQAVIEAALGCRDTSVAWYLISFLNELESFGGQALLLTSIGCQTVGQVSEGLIREAVIRRTVADNDLLHALDVSSSLLLQGQLFASKGDFLCALSSFESILSSYRNCYTEMPGLQQNLRDAVEQLGIASTAKKALSDWHSTNDGEGVPNTPTLHGVSLATAESRKLLVLESVQSSALQFVQSDNMSKVCELLTFVATTQQDLKLRTDKNTTVLELSDLLVLTPRDLIRTVGSAHESQMRKSLSIVDRLLDSLSTPQAHAISPALYSFWSDKRNSIRSVNVTNDPANTVDALHLDFQEACLLWCKGLKDAAIKLIKEVPCASLLQIVKPPGKKNAPSNTTSEVLLLLSDALCAAGNWMSHKGVYSIEEVVNDHLNPALDFAEQCIAQMKEDAPQALAPQFMAEVLIVANTRELSCHLAIARYFEQRYHSLHAKVTSRGWQQRQGFLDERVAELATCDALREDLVKEIRVIDSKLGAGELHLQDQRNDKERQFKNIVRHWTALKKEVEMDSNERDSTYATLRASLTECIKHYLSSLKLSSSLFCDLHPDDGSHYVAQYAEVVDIIFRIVGLWLSSAKLHEHADLAQEISTLLLQDLKYNKLPLQSFVLLHQQILSRLGSTLCPDKTVNQTMQTVVEYFAVAMGRLYPYHVLPTLFSLLHNNVDNASNSTQQTAADQLKSLEIGKTTSSSTAGLDERQLATRKVLMAIHKHFQEDRGSRNNSNLVTALQKLLVHYVVLAKIPTTEERGKTKGIKFSSVQDKGKRFNELVTTDKLLCQVPILTRAIPLRPLLSGQRNDWVVTLESCLSHFDVSESGISRPKFITVVGSDGLQYRQIVKGGDDLRQDAVMQQVFENVNITLQRQRRGRSRLVSLAMKTSLPDDISEVDSLDRQVYIRTYKVIPTTALTGIMEFVENTAAFGSLLCDPVLPPGAPKSSAKLALHSRHRPQDWSNQKCQVTLKNAANDSSQKVAVMKKIYENFKPVFRYFFLESFPSPSLWYSRQCQYINSVAVNSMIGYILGIGDRHAHNVLVDVNSGELVHIDFGIVFEQGQLLSVPETVPFRLTRDIIDGMGILGIEGKFRKCCEYVLRSLRRHREKLMVILEVVLFDPLYKWSLSPVQMRKKQQQQAMIEGENEDADAFFPDGGRAGEGKAEAPGSSGFDVASRALSRISSKLRGYEEQLTSGGVVLSVEDMVSLTVNASKDINNLAQIFPGWRPWL